MTFPKPHRSFRGNPDKPLNMLFLSLALHVVLIVLAMVSITPASRPLTFGGAYTVSLVSSEAVAPLRQARPASLPAAIPSKPGSQPIVVQRDPSMPAPDPVIKKDDRVRSDIDQAISDIRQRQQDSPPAPAQESVPSEGRQATGQGQASLQDAQLAEYVHFVQNRVKNNWSLPDALRPRNDALTIIVIRIDRTGALTHTSYERRSGNTYYDESAMRAVKKASPFPPLPETHRANTLEIGIRFSATELQ